MPTKGVLYIAYGEKYIKAAIRSALTVHKHNPDLLIHLFTGAEEYLKYKFEIDPHPFTTVGLIENPHIRSKVDYISKSPFDFSLYLDADTAINADISDLFRVLERFDVALAHAMHRNSKVGLIPWRIEIPQAFPQFNGGVILFRKSTEVKAFFLEWSRCYKDYNQTRDQFTLRELLWLSDLRIATLPPEYNVRFLKYHLLWSKSEAESKIFHLKQFHRGWLAWFYKASRLDKTFRKMNPIRQLRKIRKKVGETHGH